MFAITAIHPRLHVTMRLVDMLLFQAEHDDYHLTRISELIRLFAKSLTLERFLITKNRSDWRRDELQFAPAQVLTSC